MNDDELEAAIAAMRPDATVAVAVLNLAYATPKASWLNAINEAARAGHAMPTLLPSLAELSEPGRAFMAAPLLHDQWDIAAPAFRGRTVRYAFDAAYFVVAPGQAVPDALDFDAGDGRGFRSV